jgi:hypothetical protein
MAARGHTRWCWEWTHDNIMDVHWARWPKELVANKALLIVIIEEGMAGRTANDSGLFDGNRSRVSYENTTLREANWRKQSWRGQRPRPRQNVVGLSYCMTKCVESTMAQCRRT